MPNRALHDNLDGSQKGLAGLYIFAAANIGSRIEIQERKEE